MCASCVGCCIQGAFKQVPQREVDTNTRFQTGRCEPHQTVQCGLCSSRHSMGCAACGWCGGRHCCCCCGGVCVQIRSPNNGCNHAVRHKKLARSQVELTSFDMVECEAASPFPQACAESPAPVGTCTTPYNQRVAAHISGMAAGHSWPDRHNVCAATEHQELLLQPH